MYLFKRGSRYHLSFTNEDGKEIRVSTGRRTKVEATEFLRKFKLEEHLREVKREQKTLGEFVKEFVRHSSCQHSPKTTASYLTALGQFKQMAGDRPLKDYGIRDVEAFILQMRQSRSLVTVRSYHTHLSAAFEVALRWAYVEKNPFRLVKRVKLPESTPIFLTKPQFQLLLSLCQDMDLRDVLITAVTTGMRLGEILALRWEDVNLVNRTLLVRSSEEFVTKNKKNRLLPTNNSLQRVLEQRRAGGAIGRVFQPPGRRFNGEVVSKGFKRLIRIAGLDSRLHFHSLRHTFASWLVQDGASLYEVQKLLGHSTVAVTQVYSHLQPEMLHGTVNRIQLALN